MGIILVSCFIYLFKIINCYSDSESSESNRFQVTPFYDTIIYSDIADIIKDIENNGIPPFEDITDSQSQSDEKFEDLLTEYQNHLEKAHKQRKKYAKTLNPKNKIPLLRHDQFSKLKPGAEYKQNEFYFNDFHNPGSFKLQQMSFNNPLDALIPINFKGKYTNKNEVTTTNPKGSFGHLLPFDKILLYDNKILEFPTIRHKAPAEPIKSQCYCTNDYIPCECNCKQCILKNESFLRDQQIQNRSPEEQKRSRSQFSSIYSNSMIPNEHNRNDNTKNQIGSEDVLTIRIKLDLQLPKFQEKMGKFKSYDDILEPENAFSKELTTSIKLPLPYFNYPTAPFNYKEPYKFNKEDTAALHKITSHKKKKSRTNNNNKKHRKKIITFHHIKVEHQPEYPIRFVNNLTKTYNITKINITRVTTVQPSSKIQHNVTTIINKIKDITNNTPTEESVHLVVKLSNNTNNNIEHYLTEDNRKIENSIETDITKTSNITTKSLSMRKKRAISNISRDDVTKNVHKSSKLLKPIVNAKERENDKISDKSIFTEGELTYWPSITRTKTIGIQKNFTTIILENEHKKTKLNMSTDSIRQNHTKALEQVIFGDVNWDDIDTVAPVFMSFVGKYVQGILTFCSQLVCHSMNCANHICLHRICRPSDRFNNKGHCIGSNNTDSVASLESIMDLPSNVILEIVDILQNNMSGKIFGKATFCIISKCITLVASKKIFIKTPCASKELNITGHCSNAKH